MTEDFYVLKPNAGRLARERGVNQAPPEELYGHGYQPESKPEGDPPEGAQGANGGATDALLVRCPAQEFMDEEEPLAEPLIGELEDALLVTGGILLMYGKGGAGKTTLTLDAIAHLASGTPWLGQPLPRPLKIILIENEGVRAMLRRRLRAKRDTWQGSPWVERLEVMVDPWMGFTFGKPDYRQQLADWITDFEADLVIVGPLVTIGSVGGGTPEEVHQFELLLVDTWNRTPRRPAFWILHHESKAGLVSGAWDRVPDAMLHVKGQGHGHTYLHFEKVRNSSLHGTDMNLSWNGTYSFTVDEPTDDTDEDVVTRVRELYEQDDQLRTTTQVREAVGAGKNPTDRAIKTLVESGYLHEQSGRDVPGQAWNARLWYHHASFATTQTLDSTLDSGLSTAKSSESSQDPAGQGGNAGLSVDLPVGQPKESSVVTRHSLADEPYPDDDFPF